MCPSGARTCQRSTYAPLRSPVNLAASTPGETSPSMATFCTLPPGSSSVKVECSRSTLELYLRRTATSGPDTVLLTPGRDSSSTACANAAWGTNSAIPQATIAAATNRDIWIQLFLRMSPLLLEKTVESLKQCLRQRITTSIV